MSALEELQRSQDRLRTEILSGQASILTEIRSIHQFWKQHLGLSGAAGSGRSTTSKGTSKGASRGTSRSTHSISENLSRGLETFTDSLVKNIEGLTTVFAENAGLTESLKESVSRADSSKDSLSKEREPAPPRRRETLPARVELHQAHADLPRGRRRATEGGERLEKFEMSEFSMTPVQTSGAAFMASARDAGRKSASSTASAGSREADTPALASSEFPAAGSIQAVPEEVHQEVPQDHAVKSQRVEGVTGNAGDQSAAVSPDSIQDGTGTGNPSDFRDAGVDREESY